MRYTAYHGSPGPAFSTFDPARSGSTSGYRHAEGTAAFTSERSVASAYAEGDGFIGRFAFTLDHPLECDDAQRPMGLADWIQQARALDHDGVILRGCRHTAISPDAPSDIFIVFDVTRARLLETVQDGPPAVESPARHRSPSRPAPRARGARPR